MGVVRCTILAVGGRVCVVEWVWNSESAGGKGAVCWGALPRLLCRFCRYHRPRERSSGIDASHVECADGAVGNGLCGCLGRISLGDPFEGYVGLCTVSFAPQKMRTKCNGIDRCRR
jgi:hypothetical protein